MLPVSYLGPAAAEPQRHCGELDDDRRDGAVFDPDIRFGGVGADNYPERRAFQEFGSMLF